MTKEKFSIPKNKSIWVYPVVGLIAFILIIYVYFQAVAMIDDVSKDTAKWILNADTIEQLDEGKYNGKK